MANETLEQKARRISQETGLDYNNVLQGMQMGDVEFQMAVAPYMGYKGSIDPSIARFHGLRGSPELDTKGFSIPPNYKGEPVWTTRGYGKDYTLPAEAGTVNAINTAATPQVWGHEYRHQEKIDRLLTTLGSDQVFDKTSYDVFSSKGGNFEVVNNRILDVRSAQNAKEMKEPLKYLITNDIYETQSKLATTTKEKETRKLEDKLQQLNDIYFIIDQDVNSQLVKDYFKNDYKEFNRLYDKAAPYKSPAFLRFIGDDKEEKAKTAKTFKEAL